MKKIESDLKIKDLHTLDIRVASSSLQEPQGTDYILSRDLKLKSDQGTFVETTGYSAVSVSAPYSILSSRDLLVISSPFYRSDLFFAKVNSSDLGALSYIDGCSNSNIISPLRSGFPCVNFLFIPQRVNQTMHLHPSLRLGMIVGGSGQAHFILNGIEQTIELQTGLKFILPRMMRHRFTTTDNFLSVLVFHPDSDGGPFDEFNPMKTRTLFKNV